MAVSEDEALELVGQVDAVHASVGRRVVVFDLKKAEPDRVEIVRAICRNGKLRAPALRTGRTLLVGFDEETYSRVFG